MQQGKQAEEGAMRGTLTNALLPEAPFARELHSARHRRT